MKKKMTCLLLLMACVSGYESAIGGVSRDDGSVVHENKGNVSSDLDGTWLKSCGAVDQHDPETLYDIIELNFSGNEFSSSILNFTDPQCLASLSFSPNPTASGVFIVGGSVMTDDGEAGTEIDTHIDMFNGAPFDIDDFGVYLIDGDNLYFGDVDGEGEDDGSAPDLRPSSLDYNRAFIRQ